jgi:hypothetical protein
MRVTAEAPPPPPSASSFTLTVARTGNGTVTSVPAGIACGSSCTVTYSSPISVTLTALPGKNQRFVGWTGGCSGTDLECTLTMTPHTTVGASFKRAK